MVGMPAQFSAFLHPGLAWAALGLAGLPLLVHLLNRQRHRRVPWAAMVFLLSAQKRSRRRMRLEQFLLLLLRTFAILAIGFAIARPVFTRGALAEAVASRTHRVVVLDDSLSMQMAGSNGISRFDHGVETVRRLLDEWPATDPITLLTTTGEAPIRFRASLDRRQLRNWVGSQRSGEGISDWGAVLDNIKAALTSSDHAAAVVIVTDLAASDWRTTSLHERVRELGEQVVMHVAAVGAEAGNLGIHAFDVLDPLVSPGRLVRCLVEVHNARPAPLHGCRIAIRLGPRTLQTVICPTLPPFASKRVTCSVTLASSGVQVLEAHLEPAPSDSLAADDQRWRALDVRPRHPVLIVEDAGLATRGIRGGGYLATALAPVTGKARTAMLEPARVTPDALVELPLESYRFIALCDVARLSPPTWRRLERYVSSGGGLLIGLGDASAGNDDRAHAYRNGAGLLPCAVNEAVDVDDQHDGGLAVALDREPGGFLAPFSEFPESSLFRARTWRYLRLGEPDANGEVLARFENGDAALVGRRFGAGRCLLWATSLDMTWTNLPAKGDFVSLVQLMASDLARRGGAGRTRQCGELLEVPLDAQDALVTPWLETPDGKRQAVDVQRQGTRYTAVGQLPEQSGVYRLITPRAEVPIAVNVDPQECDPAFVAADTLREWLGDTVQVVTGLQASSRTVAGRPRGEPTIVLLAMGFGLLLCETCLASWFSRLT